MGGTGQAFGGGGEEGEVLPKLPSGGKVLSPLPSKLTGRKIEKESSSTAFSTQEKRGKRDF